MLPVGQGAWRRRALPPKSQAVLRWRTHRTCQRRRLRTLPALRRLRGAGL